MNKDEIINIVEKYIQDTDSNYAIMINGSWGSGKTYFYKNSLIDAISRIESGKENPKANVYISLYGISSIEALSKQLLTECIIHVKAHDNTGIKKLYKPVRGIISIISRAVSFSIGSVSINLEGIPEGIRDLFESSNMVICFDDFERCTISLNEIMGFINNLVEHCNCKVIILADEKNIGKVYANTNIEAKYQTVLSGKTLVEDKNNPALVRESNKKQNENGMYNSISIKEVKELNEQLYSENYIYKDIKEKVIGKTLYWTPNLSEIIENIINEEYKDEKNEYRCFINKYVKNIASQFIIKGNRNLRIVKVWVNAFKKIFESINKYFPQNSNNYYDDILEDFMEYSIWVVCAEGMNKKIQSCGNDDYVYYEGHDYNHIIRYKYVDEWIIKQVWDDEDFCKACRSAISRKEKESINNPKRELSKGIALKNLGEWRTMTDNDVEENLSLLINELNKGLYEFSDFAMIISYFQFFLRLGFKSVNIEIVQKKMIDIVRKYSNIQNESNYINISFESAEREKEFYAIYGPIKEEMKRKEKELGKAQTEEESAYMSGDLFYDFCSRREEYFIRHKSFMEYIDIDRLIELINRCGIEELYKIGDGIRLVYHMWNVNEFYSFDADKLSVLYGMLKDTDIVKRTGITHRIAIDNIMGFIKTVLSRLDVKIEGIEKTDTNESD